MPKTTKALQEKINAVKRDAILDAAAAVFAERDFHRATIKNIAARAGVADGTVYNYFENKDALVVALLERFTTDAGTAPSLESNAHLETVVREATRARFQMLSPAALQLFRAVLPEVIANERLRARFRARVLESGDAQPILEGLSALSGLPADAVRLNLKLEAALILGVVMLRLLEDKDLETQWERLPDALAAMLLGAFRNGATQ
jgi:AcrR family transcriptional regulator